MTLGSSLSTTGLPRPDPAQGVFETLLVVDGRPVELDAHLDRLYASARVLFGAPAAARISGPARALAESEAPDLPFARLRIDLAADAAGRLGLWARSAAVDRADLFPAVPRRLAPIAVPGGLGTHKWGDRRLLEDVAAELAGARPLLIDGDTADAEILETDRANVFAVRDGALLTPPASGRILPGVTRSVVIDLARSNGIAVHERPLTLTDLATADEAFLTGSIRGIEPAQLADTAAPGPATLALAAALRDRWLSS